MGRKIIQIIYNIYKSRPNKIEDLAYQKEVVQSLQGVLKTRNLPHLLLHGSLGTGQTSTIIALANQLFGPEFWSLRVLELNASDDRGINVVRNKVKTFAEQIVAKSPNSNFICPNYKITILDEADSMTNDAQSALRRIIEDYASTIRFCIICNYITKIFQALVSQCVKYQFKSIPENKHIERLKYLGDREDITYEMKTLKQLYQMLQSSYTLYERNISKKAGNEISEFIPDEQIDNLVLLFKIKVLKVFKNNVLELFNKVIILNSQSYNFWKLQYHHKILNKNIKPSLWKLQPIQRNI